MNKMSKRVSTFGLVAVIVVFAIWYLTLWTPRLAEVTKAQNAASAAQMQQDLTTDS